MHLSRLYVKDRVYGNIWLDSPVLIELINSPPVQRLKKLNQFGIPDQFYHLKNYSRYDHCLGGMLLLRHFGASPEEQVAGLLHDVSHRAFSHVYDWVIGTMGQEDSQDTDHLDFLRNSEIAGILLKYGLAVDRIADHHLFGLLERDSPGLCADRIDYSLREFKPALAKRIFAGLTVFSGQFVCRDQEVASEFARAFLRLQMGHWGSYEGVSRYHLFSLALKIALEKGVIRTEDFWRDDEFIVEKLVASGNRDLQQVLDYLRQKPLPEVSSGITVYKKFRYIDPLFLRSGQPVRLSEVDSDFRKLLSDSRAKNQQGIVVPGLLSGQLFA